MHASRKLRENDLASAKQTLRLLRGSNSLPTRKFTPKRDGRIRLMRETSESQERAGEETAVRRAHQRLRLPSLEQWLSARVW